MLFKKLSSGGAKLKAKLDAIGSLHGMVEFHADGNIIAANDAFLAIVGYKLPEVQGRHHGVFMTASDRESPTYAEFWLALARGEPQAGEFKRLRKNGDEFWLRGSYVPVLDRRGRLISVVKTAVEITETKLQQQRSLAVSTAISRSQAVIEFELDGTIVHANENFCATMGYSLDEIKGRHHSIFVEDNQRHSPEYLAFWDRLREGGFHAAEFKRVGKGGREVWIQASYNPVLSPDGKPMKIIKFATDVTQRKLKDADNDGQMHAIRQSQSVIEFDLNGNILDANRNFQKAMGYSLEEIRGRHHRMFVEADYGSSEEYLQFWEALRRGEHQVAQFKRLAKGGREIWILASYNPILDLNGKPFKIVKFAANVTEQTIARLRGQRIAQVMQEIADGAEQLNASVGEIAGSMLQSKTTANAAFDQVMAANGATARLASAAVSMGGIVDLIDSITGQINLLALNATIEAARAGDAGRGFAVVAGEVKNLAAQAKGATARISAEIGNARGISDEVVGSLNGIQGSIEMLREYVISTSAAVEEQSAVTGQMSSTMQRAAEEANQMGKAA